MLLRVRVRSTDGDKVDVNLPVKLIEIAVSNEALMSKLAAGIRGVIGRGRWISTRFSR